MSKDQRSTPMHTPGPWVVEDSRKMKRKQFRREILMVIAEAGGMPGLIINIGTVTALDEANARLIAAAPDLLEALVRVIPEISACCTAELLEDARAAIKKARNG